MHFKTSRALVCAAPLAICANLGFAGGLADPIVPVVPVAPPPPVSADWTGPYVGAQLGFAQITLEDAGSEIELEGLIYGVHGGYLYDLGSIVLGAELDYDLTDISEEFDFNDAGLTIEVDYIARAKLLLGYDAGAVLPYLTGGIAKLAFSSETEEADDNGTFFGAGFAYQYSPTLRFGAEVLQHRFEDFNDNPVNLDATSATLRVSYTF